MKARNGSFAIVTALSLVLSACATPEKGTEIGAGAGAAAGAIVGGIAGGGKGALIGAAAGGVLGGGVGNYLDRRTQELKKVADAKRTRDGILVTLKNDLVFQTGKADINPDSQSQLTQLGQVLAQYPKDHLRVSGYTDSTGTQQFNQLLSDERANQVAKVLRSQGVKNDQLAVQGLGEVSPVAPNQTASGRAKNRRVEILIDATDSAQAKS